MNMTQTLLANCGVALASLVIPSLVFAENPSIYCETGDPSGAGAQAYVELSNSAPVPMAKITWISARGRRSEYNLPRASVRVENNPELGNTRISTYVVSKTVRFEFVESTNDPTIMELRLTSFNHSTVLSCQ